MSTVHNQTTASNAMLGSMAALIQGQDLPSGALYVVATPIGNLADITVRALHVLSQVDLIAAEDTRNTQQLLSAYGLKKKLIALHDHNEVQAAPQLVEQLKQGARIALVSDAGTPAVSDPGARLVQLVQTQGLRVVPIPGASSLVAALSVSGAGGDAASPLRFIGFLSNKQKIRTQTIDALAVTNDVTVMFEAPHRIVDTLQALTHQLHAQSSTRMITLARELTKRFEEIVTLPLDQSATWVANGAHRQQGEYVLVLHPSQKSMTGSGDHLTQAIQWMRALAGHLPPSRAAAVVSRMTGISKTILYEHTIADKAVDESANP